MITPDTGIERLSPHVLLDGGEHDELEEDVLDLAAAALDDCRADLASAAAEDWLEQLATDESAEGPTWPASGRGRLAGGPAHGGNRERALTAPPTTDRRSRL